MAQDGHCEARVAGLGPPCAVTVHASLAAVDALDLDIGRVALDALAVDGYEIIPWNWGRPLMLRQVAELCGHVGTAEQATSLHELLAPYDGQILVAYNGTSIEGAAARGLGQLETVLERYDEAETHFETAIALEGGIGGVRSFRGRSIGTRGCCSRATDRVIGRVSRCCSTM